MSGDVSPAVRALEDAALAMAHRMPPGVIAETDQVRARALDDLATLLRVAHRTPALLGVAAHTALDDQRRTFALVLAVDALATALDALLTPPLTEDRLR